MTDTRHGNANVFKWHVSYPKANQGALQIKQATTQVRNDWSKQNTQHVEYEIKAHNQRYAVNHEENNNNQKH